MKRPTLSTSNFEVYLYRGEEKIYALNLANDSYTNITTFPTGFPMKLVGCAGGQNSAGEQVKHSFSLI